MSHLSREELLRWRDEGGDRERVIGHIAACPACRAALAEVVRDAPLPDAPPAGDVAEFVRQGYAAHRTAGAARRRRAWYGAGLLAAAAVAVALFRPVLTPERAPVAVESTTVRGSDIQLLVPSGPVRGALEFRWSSPIAAGLYRVQVRDEGGAVVYASTSAREGLPMPPEDRARLRAGRSYSWRVDALDGEGRPLATSRPLLFTVTP